MGLHSAFATTSTRSKRNYITMRFKNQLLAFLTSCVSKSGVKHSPTSFIYQVGTQDLRQLKHLGEACCLYIKATLV